MSGVCSVCGGACSDAAESVKCAGVCGGTFHKACVSVKSSARTGPKKDWYCDDCKKQKNSSSSSKSEESGTVLTKEFMVNLMEAFKKEVFDEIRSYSAEFQEFKTSLDMFSTKIDEANVAMESIKAEYKEIKKENVELKRQNGLLLDSVQTLEVKVRDLEQYSRRNNVEVNGLPTTPGENVMTILGDLGRAIGVTVERNSVVAAHRVPAFNKTRTPALIARFTTREQRDVWIRKFREKKTLLANEINTALGTSRVYIGEHLTPDNKLLLSKLKEAARDLGVRYVWAKEGKFYVRKSEGDRCYKVSSVNELKALKWK